MHVAFSSGATKSSVSSRQLLQRAWCWGRCQELPAVGRYSVRACVWHTARAHGVAARAHLRPPQPTLLWTPSTPRHQPTHSTPRVNTMARRTQLALAVLLLLAVRATTAHGRFLRQEGESPSPSPSPEAAAAASPSPSPDMAASTESPSPSQDAATTAASPSPEMAETTDAAASPAPEPAPAPAPAAAGNASSTFESVEAALAAAANTPLATFVAAVKAAGLDASFSPNTTWTILAPTDDAIRIRLEKSTSLVPADLLKPENKELLVKVLSYHIIPASALTASQLTNGQQVATALSGAEPLVVTAADGAVKFRAVANEATVSSPDIKVGDSVVHVVNDLLLPAGVASKTPTDGAAADNTTSTPPADAASPSPSPEASPDAAVTPTESPSPSPAADDATATTTMAGADAASPPPSPAADGMATTADTPTDSAASPAAAGK